jgi:hypothetical protein
MTGNAAGLIPRTVALPDESQCTEVHYTGRFGQPGESAALVMLAGLTYSRRQYTGRATRGEPRGPVIGP